MGGGGLRYKDEAFAPTLPASLEVLRVRITGAVATINADTSHRIWDKIGYGWDTCRVTRGNHVEQARISVDNTQTYTAVCDIQGDSFGTRPKKMRISQNYSLDFEHAYDYIPCFMRSMSILVCRSLIT